VLHCLRDRFADAVAHSGIIEQWIEFVLNIGHVDAAHRLPPVVRGRLFLGDGLGAVKAGSPFKTKSPKRAGLAIRS
jgi:hypothetical protein